MITLDQAKQLTPGMVLEHDIWKNADNTPQRFKVTGKVKTWKRSPDKVKIPVKRGLYETGYFTEKDLPVITIRSILSIGKE